MGSSNRAIGIGVPADKYRAFVAIDTRPTAPLRSSARREMVDEGGERVMLRGLVQCCGQRNTYRVAVPGNLALSSRSGSGACRLGFGGTR